MVETLKKTIDAQNPALPIYRRLAEELRRLILAGELKEGVRLPSEAALAESLEINLRTLRKGLKILSEQGLISQCQRRGTFVTYRQPERRMRYGVVIGAQNALNDLYVMRMLTSLEVAVSSSGKAELFLLQLHGDDAETLMNEVNQSRCDGLILFPTGRENFFLRPEFDRIPMVFVNMERPMTIPENRYFVRLADGAVTAAVKYLHRLGHRRIGYVGSDTANLQRRNQEFLTGIDALGLSREFIRLSGEGSDFYDAALSAVRELWSRPMRPTALICPGVVYAYGAWQGLMLQGVKIPQECSIIGFDINQHTNPHFSSIVQPMAAMVQKALELLSFQQGSGKALKQHHFDFPAEIEERGSCTKYEI